MTTKKVSYIQLLKEAISEYDAKSMDYKGPMVEPIVTFDGEGELATHRDASSILERYYFNEDQDPLIESDEGPDNPVQADADEDAEDPNEIVTGEEPDDIDDTMEDFEDEILGDDEILDEVLELEDADVESDLTTKHNEPLDDEDAQPMNNEIVSLENQVIQKLIQEMEDETVDKKAGDSETAGTPGASGEEAGKGNEKVTDDNDVEKMVEDFDLEGLEEDFDLLEQDEEAGEEADKKDDDEDEDEDLNVDKKVEQEGEGMGPIRIKAARELEEAFQIFKEEIEANEEDEKEDKKEDEKEDEKEAPLEEDFDLELEDFDASDFSGDVSASEPGEPLDIDEK